MRYRAGLSAAMLAGALAAVGSPGSGPAQASSVVFGPAAAITRERQPLVPRQDVGGARLAGRGIVVSYPSRRAMRLPAVPAAAYVIANAGTGQVLAARDPHGLFPSASTLKVLTAITMLPRLRPGTQVTASRLAASVQPDVVGLIPGHRYRAADLFRALLLISANDAAVALAQASGSFRQGIALMNAEAHRLQAYDVVAKQPSGLPAAGQVVSAYDEALIARQALASPEFLHYDQTLTASFPVSRGHRVTLVNQNYLLTRYRGGIGGKIGWTVASKATYIGMARRHRVTLIVTILHCTPRREITSAERLLNWGFAMNGRVRPVGVLVPPLGTGPGPRRKPGASRKGAAGPGASRSGRSAGTAARLSSGGTSGTGGVAVSVALSAGLAAAAAFVIGAIARPRRRTR